jgi:hypothetical protein
MILNEPIFWIAVVPLILFLITAVLLILFYIGAPLYVRFGTRHSANPSFGRLELEQLDPPVAEFLKSHTLELLNLGFDELTLVHIPDATSHVTLYLMMLINRQRRDKAMVTAMIAKSDNLVRPVLYFEISTRFENGKVFDTHNCRELMYPPDLETVRTQVPQVNDVSQLYELHKYVMDKHGMVGGKVLFEPGKALDYLARFTFIETFENYARRGLMFYDSPSNCYIPTLKGAFLMTWALLPPIKAFRYAILWRRARRIMAEFEQSKRGIE